MFKSQSHWPSQLRSVGNSLFLLLALVACGPPPPPAQEATVSLEERLSEVGVPSGQVDLTTEAGLRALGQGWHTAGDAGPDPAGQWAAEEDAEVWLACANANGDALELQVHAPSFLPYAFKLDVLLNGESLGRFPLDERTDLLTIDVEPGQLHAGINRVVLHSSHVESPSEYGKGSDTRRLGVRLVSLRVRGASAGVGRYTRIRIPPGGVLRGDVGAGASVLVQDASTLNLLTSSAASGRLELDLADQAGREVFVTVWNDVSGLEMGGTWRPANLVLIICDTLRNDILAQVATPNLDALFAEGVRFDNSFSHAPMTLPSHTALFSSRYPHISGVVNNGQEVPRDLPLLSDWMARSGYETHAVASLGTLWLGKPDISLDRGFETFEHARADDSLGSESVVLMKGVLDKLSTERPFFLFAHFSDPHEPYRDTAPIDEPGQLLMDGELLSEFNPRNGPHLDHRIELTAGKHRVEVRCDSMEIKLRTLHLWDRGPWKGWLKKDFVEGELMVPTNKLVAEFDLSQDETVDMQVWLADKVDPKEVPQRYKYEVARADKAIGELVAALKQRGLWENSLVVFTSDHGEAIGDHGSIGHVQTLYDELVHVPLGIKPPLGEPWSGVRDELAERSAGLVRHIDLVPTMLDVLALDPLPGQMGTSILKDLHRVLVTETHAPEAKRDKYACRDLEFKLIYTPEFDRFEMYDMVVDPHELKNVFATKGELRPSWQELLKETAKRWTEGERIEVDDAETDRLRALGYL